MAFVLRKPPKLSAKHEGYPYQLDAVREIKSLPYAAIFHEQGLGKTKIAIDLMLLWLSEDVVDTVFVVTKKTLVQNWCDELASHCHVTPRILSGNRRDNSISLNSPILVYVMNYEVISSNFDLIRDFLRTCRVGAVLDESQKIKNPDARLSTCFHSLAEEFTRRVIMTGTPVANRPYDVWSQIKFLDGGEALGDSFDDFKKFADLPSTLGKTKEYGFQLAGIMDKLKGFSVRETKSSAGLNLPSKTILTHLVALESRQAAIYSSYRDDMSYELQSVDGFVTDNAEDILKRLLRLVQCASNPSLVDDTYEELPAKYLKLVELLDDINIWSNKVIVWTGFIDNVEWLCGKLEEFVPQKVHGSMSVSDRNQSIRRFKSNKDCRVLLATPGAAKEGLTLTVANHAIFYDRSFSLDDYIQAQDRIHRISQTEECFVHNILAKNTIDEWVDDLLNAKYQAARLVQGDISKDSFDTEFNFDLSDALAQILLSDKDK
ncbi:MAG: DEAD/DEAH box helicase [Candidatus Dadabacteria bacterium]|nr:DEAD/DEAH box helicase [Candidatus Dadabacteria bacterium]